MEYKFFQLQDFIKDDTFISWVKYGEHNEVFQAFLFENPDKQATIDEASDFVKKVSEAESLRYPNISTAEVWARINDNIDDYSETPSSKYTPKLQFFTWIKFGWAAAATIIIAVSLRYISPNKIDGSISYSDLISAAQKRIYLVEKINTSDTPLSVTLEDGSIITLQKNAKLSYPNHFESNKRTVFLSGEAFFKIAKNANSPFFVYANEVITKVLGTSFNIKANEDDLNVTVSVKTGRVSVFHQNKIAFVDIEEKGLIITPNQQIVFSRKEEILTKSLVEIPSLIQNLNELPKQSFEERPVTEVLKVIESAYGIHIIYDPEQLSHCIITTTLTDESLYNKLDIMCKTIGASYKIVDAQIVIQSNGCK